MPDFVTDPPRALYLLLIMAALVGGGLFFRRQDRKSLIIMVVPLAMIAVLYFMSLSGESPRQAARDCVNTISDAINKRDWKRFEAQFSENFEWKGMKKAEFVKRAQDALIRPNVQTAVWDLQVPDDKKPANTDEFLLQFEGKATYDNKPFMSHFVGTFVKDRDGKWRLKTFTAYDYVQKRQAIELPGLR